MEQDNRNNKDPWVDAVLQQAAWPAAPAGLKNRLMARLDERAALSMPPPPYQPRALAAMLALVLALGFGLGLMTAAPAAERTDGLPYAAASTLFLEAFKA